MSKIYGNTIALTAAATALISGCSFSALTDEGATVRQAGADDVGGCELVSTVTALTQHKIVIERREGQVAEELVVLARNEAARKGANTIVPDGSPEEGRQEFKAYRC